MLHACPGGTGRQARLEGSCSKSELRGTLVPLFVSVQPAQKILEPPCTTGSSRSSSLSSVCSKRHISLRDCKSKHSAVAHMFRARQTPAIMAANAGFLQSQDLAVVGLNDSAETTAEQLTKTREVNLFSRYAEDHTHFLN